jgi:hypothetical protein
VPKNPLDQLEAVHFFPTGRDFYLFEGLGKNSQLDCDEINCAPIVCAAGVRIYSDTMTRNPRILTVKAIALQAWTSKRLGYGGTLFIPARPLRVPFGGAFAGCPGGLRLMLNGL